MNNISQENARHHEGPIETSAQYQIVENYHGALSFSYAWDEKDIPRGKDVEVRERGEFVPHYTWDRD